MRLSERNTQTIIEAVCILGMLLIVSLLGCARAQVPPEVQELKDAEWGLVGGDVQTFATAEGDTVTSVRNGKYIFGVVDGLRRANCTEQNTGWFSMEGFADKAWQVLKTGEGFGMNDPLGLHLNCTYTIGLSLDSLQTD